MKYIKLFESWHVNNLSQWAYDEYGVGASLVDRFNLGEFAIGKGFANYNGDLFFFNADAGFVVLDPDSKYKGRTYNGGNTICPKYQLPDQDFADIDKFMNNTTETESFLSSISIRFFFHYLREDSSTGHGINRWDIASFYVSIPCYNKDDKIYITPGGSLMLSNTHIFKDEKSDLKFKAKVFPILMKCKDFRKFFNDFTTHSSIEEWRKLIKILKSINYYNSENIINI